MYWSYRDDVKPLTQTRYLHQFAAKHGFYVRTSLQPTGRQTLETEQVMIGGFSQKFISVDACIADYEMDGIATICDGDYKTVDEIEETEQ